ncbi:MAG: hypothetical protein R3E95_20245 [Thiolinea sp.]
MLRRLMFLLSFSVFVSSVVALLDYWRYDELLADTARLMRTQVSTEQVAAKIEQAIAEDNPEDARMYLAVAQRFGHKLDEQAYLPRILALETPWETTRREAGRFINGFIDGDADSTAGVAGAITADFTVVGDVRDLHEQYELHSQGEEVNELIVTLAGVGVGLTAATVASAGTAAPAKSGVSALKLATRSGRLTPKLQRLLLKQGQDVFDYQKFLQVARSESGFSALRRAAVDAYNPRALNALGETAGQVNAIRRSTSLGDTLELLRYVENGDDLRRLEKVSVKYGAETKGILRLVGRGAIGTTRVLRRSTELLIAIGASLASLLATLVSMSSLRRRRG